MNSNPQSQSDASRELAARETVLLHYVIENDLRYLSHHEEIRLLTRAMIRAAWPLAYSHGFNPQPRLTLPLPRCVGTASEAAYATAELSEARAMSGLFEVLAERMPADCRPLSLSRLRSRTKPHPLRAAYVVQLRREDARTARAAIEHLLSQGSLPIERDYGPGKPARCVDLRSYIETITLDTDVLTMRLTFQDQRTARPVEILRLLKLPDSEYGHRVRQTAVAWDVTPADTYRPPFVQERN